MGQAYVAYSMKHPLYYRPMFNTALPNPKDHPEMMEKAQFAFNMLINGIRAVHSTQFPDQVEARRKRMLFLSGPPCTDSAASWRVMPSRTWGRPKRPRRDR